MLGRAWDFLVGYLKGRPYWQALEPFVVLALAFVATQVLAYEILQFEYGFSPSLQLYLGSYVFRSITVVYVALAAVVLFFRLRPGEEPDSRAGAIVTYLRANRRKILYRAILLIVAAAATLSVLHYLAPGKLSHIRVKLMDPPESFDELALAYLLYELNREQRSWYFEVDFKVFNPAILKSSQREECAHDARPVLCHAEAFAEGAPLIGIAERPLGGAYFAEHRGNVSVISTADRGSFAPLSVYHYLAYTVIVQSILIHLDSHGGLPEGAFEESWLSHGGVFQFNPRREAIKPTILAARLSPAEEELLLNRFGPEYLSVVSRLVTMDWLFSDRVTSNLDRYFGIDLRDPS